MKSRARKAIELMEGQLGQKMVDVGVRGPVDAISTGHGILDWAIGGTDNNVDGPVRCPGYPKGYSTDMYGHLEAVTDLLDHLRDPDRGLEICEIVADGGGTDGKLWKPLTKKSKKKLRKPVGRFRVRSLSDGVQCVWAAVLTGVGLVLCPDVHHWAPDPGPHPEFQHQHVWGAILPQLRVIATRTGSCMIGTHDPSWHNNSWKFYADVRLSCKTVPGAIRVHIDKDRIAQGQGRVVDVPWRDPARNDPFVDDNDPPLDSLLP